MNDKKKPTYYADQLAKVISLEEFKGQQDISFKFLGGIGSVYRTTNQLNLNAESAQAIIDLLAKLNLYNPNPQELLEQQYTVYDQGKNVSEKAFRAVLAYLYWQDGAEWDFVEEVWFKDPVWTRDQCMKVLSETFNYGGDSNVPLQ